VFVSTPTATTQIPHDLKFAAYNLNERFVAEFLGLNVETVRGYRKQRRGPQFRKICGRAVRYSLKDLLAFVDAQPIGGGGRRPAA
jgi:hypothetical protein